MKNTCVEISSWSSFGKLTKWSYLVPTRKGMAVLLNPRPCLYHSLMEFRVLFLVRSNMKRMATASLQTRGSILTNSLWPPKSQIEKVISVFRIDIVFSIKFTPSILQQALPKHGRISNLRFGCSPHPSSPPHTSPSSSSSQSEHPQPCPL